MTSRPSPGGTTGLCRDCCQSVAAGATHCPGCGSTRLCHHVELHQLSISHLDCDAFYASVEKRDRPELRDRPVIVGGGRRGVVAACCYIARLYGVRSAMPIFKALAACPEAVVIRPDMRKYSAVGRQVRALMEAVTPLVEPVSIDEAYLDLTGTEALHGASPAITLARLALQIETTLGITISVGLSANKFLAKVASDLDKPRGFSVIGRAEAEAFLDPRPVSLINGVGAALQARLTADGLRTIGQIRRTDEAILAARYGRMGRRLAQLARGEDDRPVTPHGPPKSVSAETTFDRDLHDLEDLRRVLWGLCEKVAGRLKAGGLATAGVSLKLKTPDFRIRTRAARLSTPTQLADRLFQAGSTLLAGEADGTAFRLIGIGCTELVDGALADPPDLLDPSLGRRARVERAMDALRAKLGPGAVIKGRAWSGRRGPTGV